MDLGAIVDVAIGIIFVWIVLSLTTIQIQEWITTRLDKRAKDLEDAIHEMLANPNLKAQFYDHPVIRGLTARKRRDPSRIPGWFYRYPILRGFTKEKRKRPSYIPSRQFALALFDIAMTANTEASIIQQGIFRLRDDLHNSRKLTVHQAVIEELNLLAELARSAAATEAGTAITLRTTEFLKEKLKRFIEDFHKKYPSIQLDEEVIHVIEEKLRVALEEAPVLREQMQEVVDKQPEDDINSGLAKLRRGVAALSVISPEVNQTLSALLLNVEEYAADKEERIAKARGNIEKWFDDSMDRVSGVFKRYSQAMALIIGFLLALLLNVDSIDLTLYLWRDPSVRQVLAAQATQYQITQQNGQNNPQQSLQDLQNQLSELNLPVGWGISDIQQASSCKAFPGKSDAFGVPLLNTKKCLAPPHANSQTNLLLKLGGIFLTALAARQGAPFWFDVLRRAANLRGTGPNPAEKEGKS
jgi:hypothetical protein